MNRRDLFRIGASGAAALGAATAEAAAVQAHSHPVNAARSNEIASADWRPAVFDSHQNETVIVLTEQIIPETDTPGAKAALVNRYMDLLLRDGDGQERAAFLEGLNWLDGYAIRTASMPFVRLTHSQQMRILQTLDEVGDPSLEPGRRFFRNVKAITASIYYATEAGFKELNKGGRVPSGFGCNGKNCD